MMWAMAMVAREATEAAEASEAAETREAIEAIEAAMAVTTTATDAAEEMHEAMASAVEGDGARWARAPCAGGGPCRFFVVATRRTPRVY